MIQWDAHVLSADVLNQIDFSMSTSEFSFKLNLLHQYSTHYIAGASYNTTPKFGVVL